MKGPAHRYEHRATPPRLPELIPSLDRDRLAFKHYRTDREKVERRSVVRGLMLMAILVLLGSMVRAGLGRVFVQGWWRP